MVTPEAEEAPAAESAAEEQPAVVVTPDVEAAPAAEPTAESEAAAHPERPWTPSYTVTRQGSSPNLGAREIEPAAEDISVPVPEAQSPEPVSTPTIAVEDTADEEKTEAAVEAESKPSEETAAPAAEVWIQSISSTPPGID